MLSRYIQWRATMARRLFVWFGIIIMVTVLVSSTVGFILIQLGPISPWKLEFERARNFTGVQLGKLWDAPVHREKLLDEIEEHLHATARLEDKNGRVIGSRGEIFTLSHSRCHTIPVTRAGESLGKMTVCTERLPMTGIFRLSITLLAVALALWVAALWLARQLAKPLTELAEVTAKIGDGDFSSRAHVASSAGGEITQLATSVNEMAAKIEAQIREQRTLLAAVSHELRTPIGHLRLMVEMGAERGLSEQQCRELDRELVEIDELVDQLLATSRLNFDLGEQRELDPIELAIQALERSGVDPTTLEVIDAPPVFGDATLIGRALANMIRNAQTHGKGMTRLLIERRDEALVFIVEDRGPGLPQDHIQRLFEPFVQGPNDTKGSLGLGLFLVRRVAEAHGGEIFARNNADGGACIGFALPLDGRHDSLLAT